LAWQHRKVMDAIVRCRTAALGGHRDQCLRCGHQTISYSPCCNRHCPKCQGNARSRWLAARSAAVRIHQNPIAPTASATPADSSKRPYQNCPMGNLAHIRASWPGQP
jgi:hypothetical protein